MSLIVKIMCANRGNDSHPRHGHHIYADVKEVWFNEPTGARGPQASIIMQRATDATPEERIVHNLYGNVYVMNEDGKTLSSFEVTGSAQLGMPEEAFRSWDDVDKAHASVPPPSSNHASDCAVNRQPAYRAGLCDCGYAATVDSTYEA